MMTNQKIDMIDICNDVVTLRNVEVVTLINGSLIFYEEYDRIMKEIKDRLEFLTPTEG